MARRGFTLVELLICIILMMILLSAVTMVFVNTTEMVTTTEARTAVYTNARYALDTMEVDLKGCLPFNSGQQRFILDNGNAAGPGNAPSYNAGTGQHIGNAADRLIFRTTSTVGDTLQTVEVEYALISGAKALGPPGGLLPGANSPPFVVSGDPGKGQTVGQAGAPRPLFTLVRRVRAADNSGIYTLPAKDKDNNVIYDSELCRFVISFNIEYLANDQTLSQLEPSPCPSSPAWGGAGGDDPLGNGAGPNDTGSAPYRVPYVRITIVIVDDAAERQERAILKTISIPMG